MKKLTKILSLSLLSAVTAMGLSALDIEAGGMQTVSGGAAGNGGSATENFHFADHIFSSKTVGWLDMKFNPDGTMGLAAQASLEFEYQNRKDFIQFMDLTPDLDLLRFYYIRPTGNGEIFNVSAGRFHITDKSTYVFNQNVDGVHLGYKASNIVFGATLGYTGLLSAKTNLIINETGKNFRSNYDNLYEKVKPYVDEADKTSYSTFMDTFDFSGATKAVAKDILYPWADPYFVSTASFTLPYIFANQTLFFEGSSFIGVGGPSKKGLNSATKTARNFNRFYLTGGITGPFVFSNLTYGLTTTLGTSKSKGTGNLSSFNLSWYTGLKDLTLSGKVVYASGDNDSLNQFYGFTSNAISYMRYAPEYTQTIKLGTSASFKPVKEFLVMGGLDWLYDFAVDVVEYLGWQYWTEMRLQCTTDFQFQLKEYRFLARDHNYDNAGATLTAVLTF